MGGEGGREMLAEISQRPSDSYLLKGPLARASEGGWVGGREGGWEGAGAYLLKVLHADKRERHLLKACLSEFCACRTESELVATTVICSQPPLDFNLATNLPRSLRRH